MNTTTSQVINFDAVRKPAKQASTLHPSCYTSQDWYDKEMRAIFLREWVCVGRVEQISKAGDFFTVDVVGEPLILVRNENGEFKAHVNSCRHRGATVAQGHGNLRMFRCPYHSWMYTLDGKLTSTPGRDKPMTDVEHFCKDDYGLISVRVDSWGGFLFVNFDAGAQPLSTWLGDLPEFLNNYKLDEMICTRSITMEVKANWKLPIDNFLEGYHIHTVHTKHMKVDYPQKWTRLQSDGPYIGHYLENSVARIAKLPLLDSLTDHERDGVMHMWLVPNVKLSVASSYMKFFLIFPVGPTKHRLVASYCFPRATTEMTDFEEIVGPNYYGRGTIGKRDGDWVDEIILEDNEVLERVQVGLASRFAISGRFAASEGLVHTMANYVLDRVEIERPQGFPQDTAAWPRRTA